MKTYFETAIFFLLFSSVVNSCKDESVNLSCYKKLLIGDQFYSDAPDDSLFITCAEIKGDCLNISFRSSCCISDKWIIELVGSSNVSESFPPQRSIRLSLKNDEPCSALCNKTVTFDIRSSRVSERQVVLNLSGWKTPILYKY